MLLPCGVCALGNPAKFGPDSGVPGMEGFRIGPWGPSVNDDGGPVTFCGGIRPISPSFVPGPNRKTLDFTLTDPSVLTGVVVMPLLMFCC